MERCGLRDKSVLLDKRLAAAFLWSSSIEGHGFWWNVRWGHWPVNPEDLKKGGGEE